LDCKSAKKKKEKTNHLILLYPTGQHVLTPAVTSSQLPENLLVGSTQPPPSKFA